MRKLQTSLLLLGFVVGILLTAPLSAAPQVCTYVCSQVSIYGGQACTCDDAPIVTTCGGWASGACPFDPVEDCLTQTPNDVEGLTESVEGDLPVEVTPTTQESDKQTDRNGIDVIDAQSRNQGVPTAGQLDRKE